MASSTAFRLFRIPIERVTFRTIAVSCLVVVLFALLHPCDEARASDDGNYHWHEEKGRSLALLSGESVVWRFNFGKEQSKPNFCPLAVPGLPSLVIDRPADHPWHHGLWLSWKFINGVNFWEPDPKTGSPQGRTNWRNVQHTANSDFSASIKLELAYTANNDNALLREERTMTISRPDDTGQYAIDWQSNSRAAKGDVTLSCVPVPPAEGGVAWGGYAGLSVRFVPELAAREACSFEGPVTFDQGIYRGRSNAMDYSGLIRDRAAAIAILDHHKNPRHPVNWYVIRSEMGYFNAALLSTQPLVIKAGGDFTLRYRVIVHPDRWDANRLHDECDRFNTP